ncbi:MAG: N-acetyltransferase family protein [Halobacteriota archaeon]
MAVTLRALTTADLDELIALQASEIGTAPAPPLSRTRLEIGLFDEAHGHGSHVRIAIDGGIVGIVGWVHGPGVMFAAPFIAPRRDIAKILLDTIFAEANVVKPVWIRTSTGSLESPIAAELAARSFMPLFDFIDYARSTTYARSLQFPPGTHLIALVDLDRELLLAFFNQTFTDIPNVLPLSTAQLDELLDGPLVLSSGTVALADDYGRYVGFLHSNREGAYVMIEAIGVAGDWRRRGVGTWLVENLLCTARAAGVPEARSLIASSNIPSISFHNRLGFSERYRRHVWEYRYGDKRS